ncbi:MAG: hypothetical protein MZV70_67985 [Desulfobacterales bacterium]|nr:hypothetical protein [Desulfobacterales bacterium]
MHVGDVVLRAYRDGDEAGAGRGYLAGGEDAPSRLDGRHQGDRAGLCGRNGARRPRRRARPRRCPPASLVLGSPMTSAPAETTAAMSSESVGRVESVDADHALDACVVEVAERLEDQVPGRVLLPRGDGVLEVEHHRVGAVDVGVAGAWPGRCPARRASFS